MKPVLQIPNDCSKELSNKLSTRYHLLAPDAIEISQKPPHVPQKFISSDPQPPAATSILSAAIEPPNENGQRIAMTAIATLPKNPYASIE